MSHVALGDGIDRDVFARVHVLQEATLLGEEAVVRVERIQVGVEISDPARAERTSKLPADAVKVEAGL